MLTPEQIAEALNDVIAFGAENGSHLRFVHFNVDTKDPSKICITVNESEYCHGNKEGERFFVTVQKDNRRQFFRYAVKATNVYTKKAKYFDTGSDDREYAEGVKKDIFDIRNHHTNDRMFTNCEIVKVQVPWNCQEQPEPTLLPS
jgi:hypothetical protein